MPSQLFSIPPEDMQELFDSSNSMADVLKKLGYSPYGGDHPTLYRYIEQFDIDVTKLLSRRLNGALSFTQIGVVLPRNDRYQADYPLLIVHGVLCGENLPHFICGRCR